MASVHDYIDAIESALKKDLIGFKFEGVRHYAARVREHAVFGDNGISFDAVRGFHDGRNFQIHPDARQNPSTADYIFLRCQSTLFFHRRKRLHCGAERRE